MIRVAGLLGLGLAGLALGCSSDTFVCSGDSMCVNENIAGVCQPDGNCSFPDPACDSGFRYGDDANASVAGTCVPLGGTSTSSMTSSAQSTSGGTDTTSMTGGADSSSTTSTVASTSSTTIADTSSSETISETSTGGTGQPNLVFVTSNSVPVGSLGGIAGADAMCAARARDAGLPGTYVAWLSDSDTNAVDRLAGARGWLRVDGLVFADRVEDIVEGNIFNPIYVDESGSPVDSNVVTGTEPDGTAAPQTCADWTDESSAESFRRGESHHVHPDWTSRSNIVCSQNARVYCFGIDENTPVPPPASQTGRIAFATAQVIASEGGLQAFDDACAEEAAGAGLPGTYLAAVATSMSSVALRFELGGEPWVNTLGQVVIADPADLDAGLPVLGAAIRWDAEGNPAVDRVWTGAPTTGALGTQTCGDWSPQPGGRAAVIGAPTSIVEWFADGLDLCSLDFGVYCLQE